MDVLNIFYIKYGCYAHPDNYTRFVHVIIFQIPQIARYCYLFCVDVDVDVVDVWH